MTVLVQIEHAVHDYDAWKEAFDLDPVDRAGGGVRRYRIVRPVDDPSYVAIDLEFDDADTAIAFRESLTRLWASPAARAALAGVPSSRIVEPVEVVDL
ncbi:MAG: hypothetical protein MUE82_01085 [Chloroflexi bacterium]|jgi:hypothetical protein|nr:hypothetical protein [Chloroflexota bacterium]